MQIVIDIPEEFETDFNKDKFVDCFERIIADIGYSLRHNECMCAGNYEKEIMEMMQSAFANSVKLPNGHGRLIDSDKLELRDMSPEAWYSPMWGYNQYDIEDAPTVIPANQEVE